MLDTLKPLPCETCSREPGQPVHMIYPVLGKIGLHDSIKEEPGIDAAVYYCKSCGCSRRVPIKLPKG